MTNKRMIKTLYKLLDEDSNYGRIVRWLFAIKYNEFKDAYDVVENGKAELIDKDKAEYLFAYNYFLSNITFEMIDAYKHHKSMNEIIQWSNNMYLKTKGSEFTNEDTPKALIKLATQFKQDIKDVIAGRCEHWFTKEMRKNVNIDLINWGDKNETN